MTRKAHKIKRVRRKSKPIMDINPDNCTLIIPCPLVEKDCRGCWYDKKEIKRREEFRDGKE